MQAVLKKFVDPSYDNCDPKRENNFEEEIKEQTESHEWKLSQAEIRDLCSFNSKSNDRFNQIFNNQMLIKFIGLSTNV